MAMLLFVTAVESAQLEGRVHFLCYYRELGTGQAQLTTLQRIVFTFLLATTDQLGKHKRKT